MDEHETIKLNIWWILFGIAERNTYSRERKCKNNLGVLVTIMMLQWELVKKKTKSDFLCVFVFFSCVEQVNLQTNCASETIFTEDQKPNGQNVYTARESVCRFWLMSILASFTYLCMQQYLLASNVWSFFLSILLMRLPILRRYIHSNRHKTKNPITWSYTLLFVSNK